MGEKRWTLKNKEKRKKATLQKHQNHRRREKEKGGKTSYAPFLSMKRGVWKIGAPWGDEKRRKKEKRNFTKESTCSRKRGNEDITGQEKVGKRKHPKGKLKNKNFSRNKEKITETPKNPPKRGGKGTTEKTGVPKRVKTRTRGNQLEKKTILISKKIKNGKKKKKSWSERLRGQNYFQERKSCGTMHKKGANNQAESGKKGGPPISHEQWVIFRGCGVRDRATKPSWGEDNKPGNNPEKKKKQPKQTGNKCPVGLKNPINGIQGKGKRKRVKSGQGNQNGGKPSSQKPPAKEKNKKKCRPSAKCQNTETCPTRHPDSGLTFGTAKGPRKKQM